MIKCLKDGIICSEQNMRCEICVFNDNKNTLPILKEVEKMYYLTKEEVKKKQIKREYPECSNCSFLEKRGANEVYCFYRVKDECLLKNK